MSWKISFSAKAAKQATKLAKREHDILQYLVYDLELRGPTLPDWPNYSKLHGNQYHCHLNYRWVACWEVSNKTLQLINIYYVGSRENAPY